jgi:triacylglycerol lipase
MRISLDPFNFGTNITKINGTNDPDKLPNNFDIEKATELMKLCNYTYQQYASEPIGSWVIPQPYTIKKTFEVYEKDQGNVSKLVPFGFIATSSENTDDIYLCFRGTRGAPEWEQDAKISPVECSFIPDNRDIRIHKGFQDVYTTKHVGVGSLQDQVMAFLTANVVSYTNVWVTGHSLGASLATLAIADIVTNVTNMRTLAKMYNFASPLVGNKAFANFFKNNIGTNRCDGSNNIKTCSWRVVNKNDIVPTVPFPSLDYAHVNGCSGTAVCNNSASNNDNTNNGLFEINFAEKCKDFFNDAKCFGNAHSATGYYDELMKIKNENNAILRPSLQFIPGLSLTDLNVTVDNAGIFKDINLRNFVINSSADITFGVELVESRPRVEPGQFIVNGNLLRIREPATNFIFYFPSGNIFTIGGSSGGFGGFTIRIIATQSGVSISKELRYDTNIVAF